VISLHGLVEIVSPLVFQGEDVEEHGFATIDDSLGSEGGLSFLFIEDESAVSELDGGGVRHVWEEWVLGAIEGGFCDSIYRFLRSDRAMSNDHHIRLKDRV